MTSPASGAVAVTKALNTLARDDRGRLIAALISRLRDFQLAEDVLQDAMLAAVTHWSRSGIPASPQGWLLQVAYRKALDRIRSRKTHDRAKESLIVLSGEEAAETDAESIPDERLRLIFTCCHPALEKKSQVALTLRTLGGLSTAQIAEIFLDQETTLGQRLSRAKAKIAASGIPYAVPDIDIWPERLESVLSVIYLIFTAGYNAGPVGGKDLAEEAIFLCRLLNRLHPADPEIEGCLALLMISHARRFARLDPDTGASVALGDQDRGLWRQDEIAAGVQLLEQAMARRSTGPYQLKAAIAACHCEGDSADWPQIALLYNELLQLEPTDVVRLNRAVALAEIGALDVALAEIDRLETALEGYQPFHAARAELLSRTSNPAGARCAYDRAIALTQFEPDRTFLVARRDQLAMPSS
jgi:RNA polymerase sigma factor (sigma-70 family)